MDVRLTLKKGPLEVEIEASDDDDYQSEVLEILEFLESNEEQILELDTSTGGPDPEPDQASVTADWGDDTEPSSSDEQNNNNTRVETETEEASPSVEFASELNISSEQLTEVIDIDPELEEEPFIVADTTGFGETRQERQLHGTLILLGTWQECYGADRVYSSDLKDALEFSGIDPDQLTGIYHNIEGTDSYFDRSGRGPSATVALTRPGLREARSRIRELVGV
ncbi:hypothetical protein [Halorubrum sp. CBA1229]|uniref:hypothetical protein n=1 Tax=Halorubrum sp. CBA1229 TaxID=1853699 RepID=UPI0011CD525E|nr:hypothetical protein [Halorubrum sp. CBA1229]QKY18635.1 hypothetical protein Hrr1229_017140 [Halorubrum sp. CBA1229]